MPGDIVPAGPDPLERAKAIAQVSLELAELEVEARSLAEDEERLDAEHSTALVAQSTSSLASTEARLQHTRGLALRTRMALDAKRQEMKALFDTQMADALAARRPLEAKLKRLEEGLWTLSLYAGDEERIVRLADGDPAPDDTPITVRQLVLAMDEECAVAAEDGGIDARSIEQFDAWLLEDPAHLEQVLPEPKGVVALVPRWSQKDYGDPWVNDAMEKANKQTYLLIRNGDCCYRYVTDFVAGERLVPTASELTDCFVRRERNWDTGEDERVELEPGTAQWAKAEEQADAIRRHYMRVGLILQGLHDRTPVFRPIARPVSFLGIEDYDAERIVIVTNAERLLTDGGESFDAWQERLMRELRPGMRVIGAFNTYSSKDEWDIWPANAARPESLVPHTVTERLPGGRLKILYDRTDTVWRMPSLATGWRYDDGPAKVRASCTFAETSDLVIPFDLADVEDMERFLRSRLERRRYLRMLPLLKAAIRAKRDEQEQEAPFRQMLAGVLARENGVPVVDAEDAVDGLVAWWKLANRHHRPLVGSEQDNAKAVRMIVDEHRRRLEDTRRSFDAALVERLRSTHPGALLIARKRDGSYVVLEPQDDGDAFVVETTYGARGAQKSREEWQLVGARQARWTIAYESPAWAGWDVMAARSDHLTGPEVEAAIERLRLDERVTHGAPVIAVMLTDNTHGNRRVATRLAMLTIDLEGLSLDEEHPLTVRSVEPRVHAEVRRLARGADGSVVLRSEMTDSYPNAAWRCWEPGSSRYARGWRQAFLDEEVVAAAEQARERYQDVRRRASELGDIVLAHERRVCEQWDEREERRAYEAFVARYADPELWEGHRKTLRLPTISPGARDLGSLDDALRHLVEAGQVLDGLSVAEVLERARISFGIEAHDLPAEVAELVV